MNFIKAISAFAHKKKSVYFSLEKKSYNANVNEKLSNNQNFEQLRKESNGCFITKKVPYKINGCLKEKTIDSVFDFAYDMTFGSKGEHRSYRSGGEHIRKNGEIFADTFQGKIAECAACNFFYTIDPEVKPDFSVKKLGKWDSVDLCVKKQRNIN